MSELIDKAVLIAKMYSEAFESDTDMQRWDSGCWIRYKLFEKVVDSTPTVPYGPRWHRVEDGLPDDGETVLIYDGYGWCMGMHEESGWAWDDTFESGPADVTHWMPIEPPKEEEHGN